MNTKLNHTLNWQQQAQEANWSVGRLAKGCGISTRTLQLYFLKQIKKAPKNWLVDQRQHHALKLLNQGYCIKEIAVQLGYKHPNHFSRDFKRYWGYSPTRIMQNPPAAANFRVSV